MMQIFFTIFYTIFSSNKNGTTPNTTIKQHFFIACQTNPSKLLNIGIIIDHHLSWGPQVNHVCNKATRLIGFLQRNLRNCSRALSYKQFILPVLEYAAAIWDPYHLKDINKIEMIQHRAARFVLNRPWRR